MSNSMPARVFLAALALASLALPGCSSDNLLTAPRSDQPGFQTAVKPVLFADGTWTMVASDKIIPGQTMTLSGSRYTIQFTQNAVHNAMQVSISERSQGVVDVKLEPDGTVFDEPVLLTIDYSGTPNDPDSPYYSGRALSVGRYNPGSNGWTVVPGTDDPTTRTYTVVLAGFSRYAMNDGMQIPTDAKGPGHTQTIR